MHAARFGYTCETMSAGAALADSLLVEIESEVRLSPYSRTYFVKVTDSKDPGTGTSYPPDECGWRGCVRYEVDGCCRWTARTEALNAHGRAYPKRDNPAYYAHHFAGGRP